MKNSALAILLLIVLLSAFYFYNTNPGIIISSLTKTSEIKHGDLKYRIYLLGVLPVGDAIFKKGEIVDYNRKKVYHLTATVQSLKVFARFFVGSALLDSYLDMEQLNPIVFKQKILISGKDGIIKEVVYDQKNNIMSIAGVKRQILPNTQDPLSAMFNLSRIDFSRNKVIEMNINTNQKNYVLRGTTMQRELQVNRKNYKIIEARADISRRDKNPYHKSNITMILLQEKENIPILIKVFASGMLINAKLTSIQ